MRIFCCCASVVRCCWSSSAPTPIHYAMQQQPVSFHTELHLCMRTRTAVAGSLPLSQAPPTAPTDPAVNEHEEAAQSLPSAPSSAAAAAGDAAAFPLPFLPPGVAFCFFAVAGVSPFSSPASSFSWPPPALGLAPSTTRPRFLPVSDALAGVLAGDLAGDLAAAAPSPPSSSAAAGAAAAAFFFSSAFICRRGRGTETDTRKHTLITRDTTTPSKQTNDIHSHAHTHHPATNNNK